MARTASVLEYLQATLHTCIGSDSRLQQKSSLHDKLIYLRSHDNKKKKSQPHTDYFDCKKSGHFIGQVQSYPFSKPPLWKGCPGVQQYQLLNTARFDQAVSSV